MLDERKLAVLRAIVEDYVATEEPVGSKTLVERHNLGVSSATIRNDMVSLEDEGYIAQPHTSAGRVPTDKGYRLFVDRLSSVRPLSSAERRAIQSFLDGAVDLDDVMTRTVRLLAQVTRSVAVVQYPSLTKSTVRHIELVGISQTRVLLVVIASTGRVEQRVVELPAEFTEELLTDLRTNLNAAATGRGFAEVAERLELLLDGAEPPARPTVAAIVATLMEALAPQREDRIVLGGTANLARYGQDFAGQIRPVLEALEEQVVLMQLLGEASTPAALPSALSTSSTPSALTVRIGSENALEQLTSTSVVTAGYGSGDEALARLGVLGPTRMDYPGTMASVRAVARYLGRILAEGA